MEPTPEQAAEGTILVKVLAAVLERLVVTNASLALSDPGQITKFHALKPPGIGIEAYLERIHKYACCSNECFILALIYIDRLIQRNNFLLTELNVHRVVITSILLAAKFFDDAYYNNAYYSKVGGVMVSELNGLEVDFLFRINFSLHVQPDVFEKYKAELIAHSINSGLAALASLQTPLPQIAEVESCNSGMSSPDVMQQQQLQLEYAAAAAAIHSAANSIPIMAPPAQVTPSANTEEMTNHLSMNVGPFQQPPSVQIPNVQNTLYIPVGGMNEQNLMPSQQSMYMMDSYGNSIAISGAEPQQHQQAMLQRSNSLPPLLSSGMRCVDQYRHPPYHSAPTPMAPRLPLVNVDQEQYQLVMNQLFPIQTTLMHHNHGVSSAASSSHHADIVPNNSHHHQGYHQGMGGVGSGSSLVVHY
ncbi:cyclin [Nitzschia inconspicua]|uniref:Cyclin n=1 Tax=Nitzschia inconspicua TaxID=303405 RepID=A0A9K3PIZ5_9STRA|nr:cyclin [Nitzschia inconspicua]